MNMDITKISDFQLLHQFGRTLHFEKSDIASYVILKVKTYDL